jgi:hypothetical protein
MTVATMNAATLSTGNAMAAANSVHESVINAINQLNANQAALVQKIAAMSLNNNTRPPTQITVPVPPMQQSQMQQLTIPMQVPYAGAAMPNTFNMGRGGPSGRGGKNGRGGQSRGRVRVQHFTNHNTPFANHMNYQTQGRGGRGNNGSIPFPQGGAGTVCQPATQAGAFSNLTKAFENWNVCYTCRFDIEDGHTSVTCPHAWRKANHQEGFNRIMHRHTSMRD